jgi:sulfide:quinone oxidoreductase
MARPPAMTTIPHMPTSRAHRALVAGSGVAALEAMLALHHLAGDDVQVTLVSPDDDFYYSPLSTGEPFGKSTVARYPIRELATAHGADVAKDMVRAVDPERRVAVTYEGDELPYDSLLVAVGASRKAAFPDALTFFDQRNVPGYRELLERVRTQRVRSIGFLVPSGVVWPFPLYELALMTAEFAAEHGVEVELTIVTPATHPLALFGPEARDAMGRLLAARGIRVHPGNNPDVLGPGRAYLEPDGEVFSVDALVAIPRLTGPRLSGLPHDRDGFIPTDEHGRVDGVDGVYAAGDCTVGAVKQGGLAAQQADTAAAAIAAEAAGAPAAAPAPLVLRGALLIGNERRYLRSKGIGDANAAVAAHALWWPPTKIAGRYLAPCLGEVDEERQLAALSAEDRLTIEVPLPSGEPELVDLPAGGHGV